MTLTIGLTSYKNHGEVWFTVQALRLYQNLVDTEILIIDNADDPHLHQFVSSWCGDAVRRVSYTEKQSPFAAKDRLFAEARGEWVLALDSHVLLAPGAVARFRAWCAAHPDCPDLLHGPLLYDDLQSTADAMLDEWRGEMWGTWRTQAVDPDAPEYEIPMHGMGLFACRRDAWLGFNPAFRGFGGEEGYIHAKYRRAGRRVLCLPFLRWLHYFRPSAPPFPVRREDRIQNYLIGLNELGLDSTRMRTHFGLPTLLPDSQ